MKSYGVTTLTITSPVQTLTEPITTTEAVAFLSLPSTYLNDATQAALLAAMITGARHAAEWYQGREILAKQLDLTLDVLPAGEIQLRKPLISVAVFKYKNSAGVETTLTENTDFIKDTRRGLLMPPYGCSWPSFTAWPSSAVTIRYTAGDGTLDPLVKQGMLLLISHWFNGRIPFEIGMGLPQEMPFAVTALLRYGAEEMVF